MISYFNLDKYLLELCSLHRSATASRGIGAEELSERKMRISL